jgi:3-oxoacyl-[acyl-carrier-protein] synthase III
MGIIIKSTGVSTDASNFSALGHAVIAGRRAFEAGGIGPEGVDLLINVGIYRDENMVEPAMAAIIQKALGYRLDFPNAAMNWSFSFDLMNGAGGMLNAVQVASAFLLNDKVKTALIVSGDAHPAKAAVPGFPFAAVGAAMLLVKSDDATGFGALHTAISDDATRGLEASVMCGPADKPGAAHQMNLRIDANYEARLLDAAVSAVCTYAQTHGLDLSRTIVLPSQPSATFARDLARRCELAADHVVQVTGLDGDPHTSALAFAYAQLRDQGIPNGIDHLLFVGVGSGVTSTCIAYRL